MSLLLQNQIKHGCHGNAMFVVTELSHGLPSALLPPGFGAFPGLLDSQSGRRETMPRHPLARYGYFKLYEITGNLDLVSGITW